MLVPLGAESGRDNQIFEHAHAGKRQRDLKRAANAGFAGRTVCRRAERAVVALARHERISPAILRYLNRLSDLLFVLARAANALAGRADVKW